MLTCKVGESIIDTFSFKDEKLREWSNKGMLKCPVCNEKMIYCHGDFKIPYFRHDKNSDCPDVYSEGITQEHLKGTQIIYEWLKKQEGIISLQLEKWIPETRQRPDIYFERNENGVIKKYAIEFQCSPIATKYNERHDLYRLNNIKDIWILGFSKYDINKYNGMLLKYDINDKILEDVKTKTIERQIKDSDDSLLYLINNKLIKVTDDFIETYDNSYNERKTIFDFNIDSKPINDCNCEDIIDNNRLYSSDSTFLGEKVQLLEKYIENLNDNIIANRYTYSIFIYRSNIELRIFKNTYDKTHSQILELFSEENLSQYCDKEIKLYKEITNFYKEIEKVCESFNERFKIVNKNCKFNLINDYNFNRYLFKVKFECSQFDRVFYIKEKSIDCTMEDSYTKPFRGKRGGIGWKRIYYNKTIDALEYKLLDSNKIANYISNIISDTLRKYKYGSV